MATQMASLEPPAVVIDMGTTAPIQGMTQGAALTAGSKGNDTLFGPNIGVLGGGPEWTENQEKSLDVLTPEIVKGWIAKSKETHYSTTTLQALVNLKRPTLRLSPLESYASEDADADAEHHHALEFEYDCDAPKCAIRVHVLLSPKHPLAEKPDSSGLSKLLVFETITDGGFGKMLKLEDGAMLELGQFDHKLTSSLSATAQPSTSADPETLPAETSASEAPHQRKKRFTSFHFRKRHQDRNVAGPALAVLDADAQPAHVEGRPKDGKDEEHGVRVTIRLSALNESGQELPSPNEQVTYLHVVRFGAAPTLVDGTEEEEDNRPWVVKVVKREATIGLHTFHLHEIYGLSANSTTSSQPTAPPPKAQLDTHTYPPTAPAATTEDEPSSECLLCLSSPREVVLLPCRHLVACRDCALNMIEFGAGGTIVQNESDNAPAAEGGAIEAAAAATADSATEGAVEGAPTTGTDGAAATPLPTPAVPAIQANPRRKRKAKGWSCPVCRQPYTSLLRITTTPPEKDEHRESTDLDEAPVVGPASAPAVPPTSAQAENRGRFGFIRNAFGRSAAPQLDVERGTAPAANAA